MQLIPRAFIQELVARTDLFDLINRRVPLIRKGNNGHANCPFHVEKTPSFTVSIEKQFYHCFGCRAHGNAIDFLMAFEQLSFPEAIEALAANLGVAVPYEGSRRSLLGTGESLASLAKSLDWVTAAYEHALVDDVGKNALAYLAERQINRATQQRYRLGYVAQNNCPVLRRAQRESAFADQLFSLGILKRSAQGRLYNPLSGRLCFPIRSKRGQVVGFGGRALQPGQQPKYLNSGESILFKKGEHLYGAFEAFTLRQDSDRQPLVLVEGYFDVLALSHAGYQHVVASLGTALTDHQMHSLLQQSTQIVCCYDGDEPGRTAAWKVLERLLPHWRSEWMVRFLFLPEGNDPDNFVRQFGLESFRKQLHTGLSISQFLFKKFVTEEALSTAEGRARAAIQLRAYVQKIPDEMAQASLLQTLSQRLGLMNQPLNTLVDRPAQSNKQKRSMQPTPMRMAIGLLLKNPELSKYVQHPELLVRLPGGKLLNQLVKTCQKGRITSTGVLLEAWRFTTEYAWLQRLILSTNSVPSELVQSVFLDVLEKLHNEILVQRMNRLSRQDRLHGLTKAEREEYAALLKASK